MSDKNGTAAAGSNEHTSLLSALHAVQAECPTLPKDAVNPHFKSKFTPLDTIVEIVKPLLQRHGLTWSTFPTRDEHGLALRYSLGHVATGETLEDTMPLLLAKQDAQAQGSAITYARRYSICAVLNLVADEDEDGNAARRATAQPPKPAGVPIGRDRAVNLHDDAVRVIDADKLRQAVATYTGTDPGDLSDRDTAITLMASMDEGAAGKLADWLGKKLQAAEKAAQPA